MTDKGSILFKLFEPMMFRGPGEFDPYVRGTHSRAVSMSMPSPSTIAGAIATYIMTAKGLAARSNISVENWLQLYLEILGEDTVIRGPVLMVGESSFLEHSGKEFDGFLQLSKVRERCGDIWSAISSQDEKKLREALSPRFDLKVDSSSRIGVMLEKRSSVSLKYVKEGFLYGVDYVDYGSRQKTSVYLVVDVYGSIVDELSQIKGVGVRLGGEGRVSLMTFTKNTTLVARMFDEVWKGQSVHSGLLALYVASPALFKGGGRIIDQVRDWCRQNGLKFMELVGRGSSLGAGFMLALNRRKPIYSTLLPGSVVFVEGKLELEKFFQEYALGEAGRLGFGTLIPVPLG